MHRGLGGVSGRGCFGGIAPVTRRRPPERTRTTGVQSFDRGDAPTRSPAFYAAGAPALAAPRSGRTAFTNSDAAGVPDPA